MLHDLRCDPCDKNHRHNHSDMTRREVVDKLDRDDDFKSTWQTEKVDIDDSIRENILSGKGRQVTQRRMGKQVKQSEEVGIDVKVEGHWYTVDTYPFGDPKANKHKTSTAMDPLTKKRRKMINYALMAHRRLVPCLRGRLFCGEPCSVVC